MMLTLGISHPSVFLAALAAASDPRAVIPPEQLAPPPPDLEIGDLDDFIGTTRSFFSSSQQDEIDKLTAQARAKIVELPVEQRGKMISALVQLYDRLFTDQVGQLVDRITNRIEGAELPDVLGALALVADPRFSQPLVPATNALKMPGRTQEGLDLIAAQVQTQPSAVALLADLQAIVLAEPDQFVRGEALAKHIGAAQATLVAHRTLRKAMAP